MHEHGTATWPDVQLSNYAGKRIAQTLDQRKAFEELKGAAIEGRARVDELSLIGKSVHPTAIEPDSEEATLLRQLFFGDDPGLCQGQQSEHIHWRRTSLLLMLQFLRLIGKARRVRPVLRSPGEDVLRSVRDPAPVQTKFLRLSHAVPLGHRIDGWRVCWVGGWRSCRTRGQRTPRQVPIPPPPCWRRTGEVPEADSLGPGLYRKWKPWHRRQFGALSLVPAFEPSRDRSPNIAKIIIRAWHARARLGTVLELACLHGDALEK